VQIGTLDADILSNKKGKNAPSTGPAKMPNQLISAIPFNVGVDTIRIANASIKYGEARFYASKPAELRFQKMKVMIANVTSDPAKQKSKPLTIEASGIFMEQAPMQATLRIPLDVKQYRLEAEGSMGKLDVTRLNSFLPTAENMRMESGVAGKASFKFVVSGRKATGYVDAYYMDMKIKVLDAKTKKTGLFDSIISFAANWLVIRNDNPAGEDHVVGKINYTLPSDAAIMQTLWFPIRAGLGDVAGF
jgi:hypothetical protein